MLRITIFNEGVHEQTEENVRRLYPEGIHGQLRSFLQDEETSVRCFTLATVNDITEEVLKETDVMIWWAHMLHHEVPFEVAWRVREAVNKGMGIIFLHSGHHSLPFKLLMGTSCNLIHRSDGDYERIWTVNPEHPIAQGIGPCFVLPHTETYGEPFAIPEPDEVVFIGAFEGGEVFRSGCTFHRENGRIFYFQPGHETYPIFYDSNVQRIIRNAVQWVKPIRRVDRLLAPHVPKPEPVIRES